MLNCLFSTHQVDRIEHPSLEKTLIKLLSLIFIITFSVKCSHEFQKDHQKVAAKPKGRSIKNRGLAPKRHLPAYSSEQYRLETAPSAAVSSVEEPNKDSAIPTTPSPSEEHHSNASTPSEEHSSEVFAPLEEDSTKTVVDLKPEASEEKEEDSLLPVEPPTKDTKPVVPVSSPDPALANIETVLRDSIDIKVTRGKKTADLTLELYKISIDKSWFNPTNSVSFLGGYALGISPVKLEFMFDKKGKLKGLECSYWVTEGRSFFKRFEVKPSKNGDKKTSVISATFDFENKIGSFTTVPSHLLCKTKGTEIHLDTSVLATR